MTITEELIEVPFDVTVLRPATKDDSLCVRGMFFEYLSEIYPLGHDVQPTQANARWYWETIFRPEIERYGDSNMIVLATRDGFPIAALFWAMALDGTALGPTVIDHGVWVRPANRGEHLGERMQRHAITIARHRGATSVFSTVLMGNKWGIASAKKLGCEFTGYVTKLKV